jgi:hypothetical protein
VQSSHYALIYVVYHLTPPLWSSGQSSWLKIQRSVFDSRRYQISWDVVCLERGPFSLVSTIEELLEIKSSGSGLEIRDHGSRHPWCSWCWPRDTLYPQNLTLTLPTSGSRSIVIVRLRNKATEFSFSFSILSERIFLRFNCRCNFLYGTRKLHKPLSSYIETHNLRGNASRRIVIIVLCFLARVNSP